MIVSLADGVRAALDALRSGDPVVLPTPSPLAYLVAGTSPEIANRAKSRPAGQPAGIAIADFPSIAGYLDVDHETVELISWLCCDQQINVFAPLADHAPGWMVQDPKLTGGYVGLFGAWLPDLQPILDERGYLYISSANRTGTQPATTATVADAAFEGRVLVVDGDSLRDPGRQHGSASIVRVGSDGTMTLARHGINDLDADGRPTPDEVFLSAIRQRWSDHR